MTTTELVLSVVAGFVSGAVAAGIGYIKRPEGETFDGKKMVRTVIIGGVVGAGTKVGIPEADMQIYLAYPLVVYALDAIVIVVWRKVGKPIYEKLKELFGK